MPTYQLLTDRTLAQSSAITPTTLIHIVYTGDPSQNIAGSSYKAELQQLSNLFSGSTFTGGTVNGLTANTISATTYLNVPVPTLNQVLVEGNETLGENIILNDMDTMINSGGTIGIQYKTGNTMYQYVTDNIYKTSRLQMDSNGFYLDNFNYDDGWYQQILVDSSAAELNIKSGNIGVDLFSRTIYQPGSIGHYVGDSGSTNYLSVNHNNTNYIITKVASSIEVNKFSIVNDVATYYGTKFNINNYLSASTIYATTISGDSYFIKSVGSGTPLINLGLDSTGRVVTGTTGGGSSIDLFYDSGSGTTITWDVSGVSTNYEATLTATTTLNLTNVTNGDYGTIIIKQDGVGGRTLTLGTVNGGAGTHRVANGGGGSVVLTSNANATDILTFTYNGSIIYWTVGNDYT